MNEPKQNWAIKNTRLRNINSGFTLIEMVLVIIIIGLLLTGAVFGYLGYERAANNRVAMQNYVTLMTAKITWCAQNQGQGTPTLGDIGAYVNNGIITTNDLSINGVAPTGSLATTPLACNTAGEILKYTGTTFGTGGAITCTSTGDSPTVNDTICLSQ